MFQRILLAWQSGRSQERALELARSLAERFDAELAVCCLGDGAADARAAAGPEATIDSVAAAHAGRGLLRYAHTHGFDLLVMSRAHENEPLPRQVIDSASLPVLVVAEGDDS